MKQLVIIITLLISPFILLAQTGEPSVEFKDTVIIEFGNNSKMVIYLKDKEDLDQLLEYDINSMLSDLSMSIDSAEEETNYLVIEDSSGQKYLSDTTIVVEERDRDRVNDENHKEEIHIRLGNIKLSGKVTDWDDYEDDLDQWEDGPDLKKSEYEEKETKTFQPFDIELGMNNYLENGSFPDEGGAPYAVKPWGSWYVALGPTWKSNVGGSFFLEWGANVSWYNFKFDNPQVRLQKTDEQLLFPLAPVEINSKKSKLTASYLNVSLVPLLDFSKGVKKVKRTESQNISFERYKKQGFRIGLGGYAGYRLGSHTKYRFKENGDSERDKDSSNFFLNNWRYGLRLRLGWKGLDVFANYDLNHLFIDNKGPELNAFSFGIML